MTALDVGRGQIHERLRSDDRVTVLEGVNARLLAPGDLPGPAATLAVVDVSFISLALVLPPIVGVLAHPYRLLPMVKPQFEAGRDEVRKGVVRDPGVHGAVLERVAAAATEAGGVVLGACETGHPGPAGNREFFLHIVSSDHPEAAERPGRPATAAARCRRLSASPCAAWRCRHAGARATPPTSSRASRPRPASSCSRPMPTSRRPTS